MTADAIARAASGVLGVALHPQTLRVGAREVHLWSAPLDELAERAVSLASLLADEERAQAAEMRVPRTAARFTGGRAALRTLLGHVLDLAPASLRLVAGRYGKPALDATSHDHIVGFNVAHSAGVIAVAIAEEGDVGVDIERRREMRELERMVARTLTPAERALFDGWCAEGCSRLDAYFRAWTVKEARLKALGLHVGAGLSRDHPEAALLPWLPVALPHGDDYFAAVAVSSSRS